MHRHTNLLFYILIKFAQFPIITLRVVSSRYEKVKANGEPVPVMILVGLKADRRQSERYSQSVKSRSDCELAARNLGMQYVEVSSHKQDTVEKLFDNLLDMIEESLDSLDVSDSNNNSIRLNKPESEEKVGAWRCPC